MARPKRGAPEFAFVYGEYRVYKFDDSNFAVDKGDADNEGRRFFPDLIQSLKWLCRRVAGTGKLDAQSILKRIELFEKKVEVVFAKSSGVSN